MRRNARPCINIVNQPLDGKFMYLIAKGNLGTLKLHRLSDMHIEYTKRALHATVSIERRKWLRRLYHEHVKLLRSNFNHSSIRRIGRKVTRNRKAFKHMKKPKHISCKQKEWTRKFWSLHFQPIRRIKIILVYVDLRLDAITNRNMQTSTHVLGWKIVYYVQSNIHSELSSVMIMLCKHTLQSITFSNSRGVFMKVLTLRCLSEYIFSSSSKW